MNCLRRPNRPMPTGAKTKEGRPLGPTWRRLQVSYPDDIATHSSTQTLYINGKGLLKRLTTTWRSPGARPARITSRGMKMSAGPCSPRNGASFLARQTVPRALSLWSSRSTSQTSP